MTDLKLTIGDSAEEDAAKRFIDAWHRAEAGETFQERHLAFESWEGFTRTLTSKRLELLRHVHQHPAVSMRALAKALARDYSNVHADVQALAAAGLLDMTGDGIRADYETIETKIAI